MSTKSEAEHHKVVTRAVHDENGKICMQILHTGKNLITLTLTHLLTYSHLGRYAYHFSPVSASAIKSPITPASPKALTAKEIHETINDFITCAMYAKEAGYDGVEIMGTHSLSHYLIHSLTHART